MFMYVASMVMVLGCVEWFMIWIGMEVNMMSFISMFVSSDSWESVESMYKYFFIQGMSSGVFLVMVFVGSFIEIPLMMSAGGGPFFFWFPSVMLGLSWWGCFLLMTFQKFIPLVVMSSVMSGVVVVGGLISMVVGVMGSFNQQMISALMAYSSVNHLGWIMLSMKYGENLWVYYFVLYGVLVFFVTKLFSKFGVESMAGNMEVGVFSFFVFVMSMGGVPPFLGFIMKWIVFEKMMGWSFFVLFVMIVSSLVMIYIYVRMLYDVMVGGCKFSVYEVLKGDGLFFLFSVVGAFLLPGVIYVVM